MTNPTRDELEAIIRQAEILSKSTIVPKDYRNNVPNIVAAALAGSSFDWDCMTSMRMLQVIQGQASVKPEALLALIRKAGHNVEFTVLPDKSGIEATGTRADNGDTGSATFTMDDAKRANLLKNGTWGAYPLDMCQWRAVSRLARQLFSDCVLGAGYTPEEIALAKGADVVVERDGDISPRDYLAEAEASSDIDEVRSVYQSAKRAMESDAILAAIIEHGKTLAVEESSATETETGSDAELDETVTEAEAA